MHKIRTQKRFINWIGCLVRSIREQIVLTYHNFAHFAKDHSRDFFGCEQFLLFAGADFDGWFRVLFDDFEWKVFDILLYS